jgi:hypothetical protein
VDGFVRSKVLWPGLVVALVVCASLVPLLFDPRFYWVDDTQAQFFGRWYEIGRRLLAGEWSLIDPGAGVSGNHVAQAGWGLFSPLLWLVGLGAHAAGDALVYSTVLKIALLVVLGLSAYVLARSFAVSRPWAAVVGVAAPTTGFVVYMDAASWADALLALALWPLAWAALRWAVLRNGSAVAAVVLGALVLGVGYGPASVLYGVAALATAVPALLARRAAVRRTIPLLVALAAFAAVVYAPIILTARGHVPLGVWNTGVLTIDLSGLAGLANPVSASKTDLFGDPVPNVPLLYVTWIVPFLALIDGKRALQALRGAPDLLIFAAVALVAVLGPSNAGGFSGPARVMPFLALAVLVGVALAIDAGWRPVLSRRSVAAAVLLVVAGAVVTFQQAPTLLPGVLLCGVGAAAAVLAYASSRAVRARRTGTGLALIALIGTVVAVVPQHLWQPSPRLPDYGVPTAVADLARPLAGARGPALVVGDPTDTPLGSRWKETLVGDLWYVSGADVVNGYAAAPYNPLGGLLCDDFTGATCPELYSDLFQPLPDSGALLADVLALNTVQVVKATVPAQEWRIVPEGWRVVDDTRATRTLERVAPGPGAGGVVWSSPGTAVTVLTNDADTVRFRVDAKGDQGRVELARLAWPGYSSDGGGIGSADGGFLTVSLEGASVGDVVTVAFRSPGWQLQAGAALVFLASLAMLALVRVRRRRRNVRPTPQVEPERELTGVGR